ncbi:MAG: hypothetical protein ACRBBQ_16265 [Cognatishimia sp.]
MKRHIRTLLSVSRNLANPLFQFGLLRIILLTIFGFVALYYSYPRTQSFTIVASTQSVTATLSKGHQQPWSMQNAVLCHRHTGEDPLELEATPQDHCDSEFYKEIQLQMVDILWTPGHRLTVSGHDGRYLAVEIETFESSEATRFGEISITNNSILFFDRTSLDELGGLVAKGQIEIGQIAEAGAAKLTRGGRYQIRENLGAPSHKTVVASGDILTGDRIRLVDRDNNGISATMFMTSSANNLGDFDVILTSPEQRSAIEFTRIGGGYSTVTTRWTDRIANDALPVALSIFLGLFGASLGIARSLLPASKETP